MARRVGRPSRTGGKAMESQLQIRVTPEELAAYSKAAEAAGKDRSTWIRELLNTAAGHPMASKP